MKKRFKIIVGILLIVLLSIIVIFILNRKDNSIPEHYIAVFHGTVGETIYETYIYKIDNNHANYGFQYINVTKYGSSNSDYKITGKGDFDWTDGAFIIAKKNNSYSYVTLPNDNKKYTIEEFQKKFLMN